MRKGPKMENLTPPTDYLNTSQAAEILGVAPGTLCRWLGMGIGPRAHKTPGGHWRISRRAVLKYLEALRHA